MHRAPAQFLSVASVAMVRPAPEGVNVNETHVRPRERLTACRKTT